MRRLSENGWRRQILGLSLDACVRPQILWLGSRNDLCMEMRNNKKTVPLYAVEDLKKGKEAKPIGRMRNPDLPGCVVDLKTFEKLYGVKFPD